MSMCVCSPVCEPNKKMRRMRSSLPGLRLCLRFAMLVVILSWVALIRLDSRVISNPDLAQPSTKPRVVLKQQAQTTSESLLTLETSTPLGNPPAAISPFFQFINPLTYLPLLSARPGDIGRHVIPVGGFPRKSEFA